MKQYWFTSDTHFGHTNVLKHSGRPFASLEEMDQRLVENWNQAVQPGDDVFHLGDFAWRDAKHYRDRLQGNIYKIKGNHHSATKKIEKDFIWYRDVMEVKIPHQTAPHGQCNCGAVREHGAEGVLLNPTTFFHHHQCAVLHPVIEKQRIWLSHYAHRVWPRMHHGVWHLYGHSHGNLKDDVHQLSMDVGVDAIARYMAGIELGPRDLEFEEICEMKLEPEHYRPISFTEVQRFMSYKHFTPVDHHTGPEVGG